MTFDLKSSFPTLTRAPITEALIDIRVELPSDSTIETLKRFSETHSGRFKLISQRYAAEATMKFTSTGPVVDGRTQGPDGYLLQSEAEALMLQARLDGFTVNKIQPYTNWNDFSALAQEFWSSYVSVARPKRVTRLALRYFNKLDLPLGRSLKDFLLTVPEIAPTLPQSLPDFLMRLVVPKDAQTTAIITEGTMSRDNTAGYPVMLDLDVFTLRDLDPATNFWPLFEDLRLYKNQIFFGTLKEDFWRTFL